MPDGRKRQVFWECTNREQEIKSRALLDAGAKFECEMLMTGQMSATIEMKDNEGEMQTLAHEICENTEAVINAITRLVERAHESMLKRAQI